MRFVVQTFMYFIFHEYKFHSNLVWEHVDLYCFDYVSPRDFINVWRRVWVFIMAGIMTAVWKNLKWISSGVMVAFVNSGDLKARQ